ncbi:MAG: hypothetical protein M1832_005481 [Thelocarpon impressellum]|nr:MAG: hypothetical protein M1832_005481 [Thelocarpon impressellum]
MVMTSPNPTTSSRRDSAAERVSRVTDMLNDVEKQIRQYISEQRIRDHLELDRPERGPARNRSISLSPSPSPSPVSTASRTPPCAHGSPEDIPLDLIFDTPETQVSPVRSPRCELNRRKATFHRVDSATADYDDLRSHHWSQLSNDPRDRALSTDLVPGEFYDGSPSRPENVLPGSDTSFKSVMDSPEFQPRKLSRPSPAALRARLEKALPPPPRPFTPVGDAVRLDRRRSRSLSQIRPAPLNIQPVFVTHLRSRSASPRSPSTDASLPLQRGSPSEPLSPGSGRPQSAPASPFATSESAMRSPLFLEDGSIRKTLLADRSEWLEEALRLGIPMQSPVNLPLSLAPPVETAPAPEILSDGVYVANDNASLVSKRSGPRKWLPTKLPGPSAKDSKVRSTPKKEAQPTSAPPPSKVRPAAKMATGSPQPRKAKRQPSKKHNHVKKWGVGESVTDLLSGRMFQRVQVNEIIDTTALIRQSSSKKPRPAYGPQQAVEKSLAANLGDLYEADHQLPPPRSSVHPALRPRTERGAHGALTARKKSHSGGLALAVAEEEVALSTPAPLQSTEPSSWVRERRASRIPSPSWLVQKEVVPGTAKKSTISSASQRLIRGPVRPMAPTDPSDSPLKSQSEDLDWTAFQMAISGPTGGYLMGGDTTPSSADDDEIIDWFVSYGFETEGLLVNEDPTSAHAADFEPVWADPVELPALDSAGSSARSSAVGLSEEANDVVSQASNGADDVPANKMSCNLNDLGDYLSFETYPVGAVEDL